MCLLFPTFEYLRVVSDNPLTKKCVEENGNTTTGEDNIGVVFSSSVIVFDYPLNATN